MKVRKIMKIPTLNFKLNISDLNSVLDKDNGLGRQAARKAETALNLATIAHYEREIAIIKSKMNNEG